MRQKFDKGRILRLCEPGDYGILAPPMKAQVALDELCRYLLGDNWYDSSGATNCEQVNTAIVCAIERKFKGSKITDFNAYERNRGLIPFFELPINGICRYGSAKLRKISDSYVPDKTIGTRPLNAIDLDYNYKCTIKSSTWVCPVHTETEEEQSMYDATDSEIQALQNKLAVNGISKEQLDLGNYAGLTYSELNGIVTGAISYKEKKEQEVSEN